MLEQLYSCPSSGFLRLDIQQITELTRDYSFNLPTEILELYQMGNGCLPIGLDPCKDWNSPKNYFMFSDAYHAQLLRLEQAMDYYHYDIELPISRNQRNINTRLFPIIVGNYRRFWAITGTESQSNSSSVVFYHSDYPERTKLVWSSLTNLLQAWVEIKEQQLNVPKDEDKVIKIASQCGGVTEGNCEGLELLYYLSFRLG